MTFKQLVVDITSGVRICANYSPKQSCAGDLGQEEVFILKYIIALRASTSHRSVDSVSSNRQTRVFSSLILRVGSGVYNKHQI